jgi:MoxR-like ATPase
MTTIKQVKQAIKIAFQAKVPLFIWGPPGIGKSSVVRQVADDLNIDVIDLRLTLLDPVDLRGLPKISSDSEKTVWAPPAFLPTQGEGILLLDEINLAAPAVQAAAYQLILDRQLGEYRLPTGWAVFAAGNRLEDRANVFDLPAPLANRFAHIQFPVPSPAEWSDWATKNGIHPHIVAFINFKPQLLFKFDSEAKSSAFPTPRTWEYASRLYSASGDPSLVRLAVGDGAGAEFVAFTKLFSQLPNVDQALADPQNFQLPTEISLLHAFAGLLADRVAQLKTSQAVNALCVLVAKMPPELGILTIKMLLAAKDMLSMLIQAPAWQPLSLRWAKYVL